MFFDRDGVLNEVVWRSGEPGSPRNLAELRMVAGARDALERLQGEDFLLFIATNQPDVARGHMSEDTARAIAAQVAAALPVADAEICVHDDADDCRCRKPRAGMIENLKAKWPVAATASYVVGDRWRDMEAGRAAGCRTVLLRRSYNAGVAADVIVDTLQDAVARILAECAAGRAAEVSTCT